jgi:hypothetical protein
VRKRS